MALIPPSYLNAVVSIEVEIVITLGVKQKKSIATGFLIGNPTGESNDQGPLYKIFLVTNKHVFQNLKTKEFVREVFIRFNTIDNKSHYFKVELIKPDGVPLWYMHRKDEVDLAVLPVNANAINDAKINYYFFSDADLMLAKEFAANNISTGDGLFVLGFPMSISGKARNFVIVRQGIIARVDEEVLEESFYYIDASAYPGNSGGPVIHKPEMLAIQGTSSNSNAGLIGVISSGITYSDVAVSQQTGEPKVVFTEQTGLIKVIPIELIFEIIDAIPGSRKVEEAKIEDVSKETSQ